MPCYDPRPGDSIVNLNERLDRATRVACEMIRLLNFISANEKLYNLTYLLSEDAQKWIEEHERLDQEKKERENIN